MRLTPGSGGSTQEHQGAGSVPHRCSVVRLPAIPSYELSREVEAVGRGVTGVTAGDQVWGVTGVTAGDQVWGMTEFHRGGVAAAFAVVPAHPPGPEAAIPGPRRGGGPPVARG